ALWHDRTMLSVSRILIPLLGETLRWWRLAFRSTRSIKAENLFLRPQLALYVERGIKPRRGDPVTRISLTILQLARGPGGCASPDDDPLASGGLETVLAPEVSTRPTADSSTITGSHPPHGERESVVGRGAHCQRACAEAGNSGVAANRTEILTASFAIPTERRFALVHLPAATRPRDHCL